MASFLPLLTLLTVALFASAEGRCWRHCRGWGRCHGRYFLPVLRPLSMPDAESYCMRSGGHLASYHNLRERKCVLRLIWARFHRARNTWTGLYDALKEGRWFYTDGSRFNYRPWNHREPNNWRNEDCVEMYSSGRFNDLKCGDRRSFVCAKRA
ncbi:galactose-specific lectin nattectin-like [Genypterus blacodes]|uniref:galactose-specific lectin nattectin-like n=1 Tax=Genypterus blacodes TaxID=154954 RepID=UPI003F75AF97